MLPLAKICTDYKSGFFSHSVKCGHYGPDVMEGVGYEKGHVSYLRPTDKMIRIQLKPLHLPAEEFC